MYFLKYINFNELPQRLRADLLITSSNMYEWHESQFCYESEICIYRQSGNPGVVFCAGLSRTQMGSTITKKNINNQSTPSPSQKPESRVHGFQNALTPGP